MNWAWAAMTMTAMHTIRPPNAELCEAHWADNVGTCPPSSRHQGGAHILMADGAVIFYTDSRFRLSRTVKERMISCVAIKTNLTDSLSSIFRGSDAKRSTDSIPPSRQTSVLTHSSITNQLSDAHENTKENKRLHDNP